MLGKCVIYRTLDMQKANNLPMTLFIETAEGYL